MPDAAPVKKIPQWWNLLPRSKQLEYLKSHPKSRLRKHVKQKSTKQTSGNSTSTEGKQSPERKAAIQVLSKNKEARLHVRAGITAMSEHPESVLDKKTMNKLSEKNIRKKLGEQNSKKLDSILKKIVKTKNKKKFLEVATKVVVAAGLITIGGALLTTGTLPFAILTGHLLKEAKGAYDEFATMVDKGHGTLKSLSVAMGKGLTKSMSNPATLAAATVLLSKNNDKKVRPVKESKEPTKKQPEKQATKEDKPKKVVKKATNETKQTK